MAYSIKEMFYTLQGEGAHMGRPAVFCRFSGCNLWTGREQDRHKAVCTFCDTDFVGTDGEGGGRFGNAKDLANAIARTWTGAPHSRAKKLVVCTGGEPLLQLDEEAIEAMHAHGFEVAVETNGTQPAPQNLDWICVSPKADAKLVLVRGDELKLVYPQEKAMPERFDGLDFKHYFLQPMDCPKVAAHTAAAIEYCKAHPQWRLSVQTHKIVGIP